MKLKIWPEFFNAVLLGHKRYEVRKADRDFMVGSILVLEEFEPSEDRYTGRTFTGHITYVTKPGSWGLPHDICVFGFEELK